MVVLNFIGHVSHSCNDANQQSRWLNIAFVNGNTNIPELESSNEHFSNERFNIPSSWMMKVKHDACYDLRFCLEISLVENVTHIINELKNSYSHNSLEQYHMPNDNSFADFSTVNYYSN